MSKYNARRTRVDNLTFDSQMEAARYCELSILAKAGEIEQLTVHPRFCIWEGVDAEGCHRKINYVADFSYYERGNIGTLVVEDVKGVKTAVYNLKKKIFLCKFWNVRFVEITK